MFESEEYMIKCDRCKESPIPRNWGDMYVIRCHICKRAVGAPTQDDAERMWNQIMK